MPKYSVILEGKNFPMNVEGRRELWGFATTRRVKAKDPEEAELKAVEMIKKDKSLIDAIVKDDPVVPTIYLDSMYKLSWWRRLGGKGYTFYTMEE
jgi:hypothetical protein